MAGPPEHVELPNSARRGQDIDATIVGDTVLIACPTCGRLVDIDYIVTENECPGGHTLDLVLLQGDSAKRGPP